jgi:hypothetical protein
MQSEAVAGHACPFFVLQTPAALQVFVPLQLSASSPLVTATQVPPVPVQAWQVPHDDVPQQCPSTQAPVLHRLAVALVQAAPGLSSCTQAPDTQV